MSPLSLGFALADLSAVLSPIGLRNVWLGRTMASLNRNLVSLHWLFLSSSNQLGSSCISSSFSTNSRYGVGTQKSDSWAVGFIGYGFLCFGLATIPPICMTYGKPPQCDVSNSSH